MVAMLFVAALSSLEAKEIKGKVHHNKKGIADVVIEAIASPTDKVPLAVFSIAS